MSELFPEIDEAMCTQCGTCAAECVRHSASAGIRRVAPGSPGCSRCFHCYAVCPRGAIVVRGMTDASDPKDGQPHVIDSNDLTRFLASRRSTRRFQKREVPSESIRALLDAAKYIPSGGNRHAHEFTVITGEETRRKLMVEMRRIYGARSTLLGSPILTTLLKPFADPSTRAFLGSREYATRMRNILERLEEGDDPVFYDAPAAIAIHSRVLIPTPREDSVLAGYSICLAAQSMGLGSCFVTLAQNAINSSRKCKTIIGLSPRDKVHAVVLVGYPAVKFLRPAPRASKEVRYV